MCVSKPRENQTHLEVPFFRIFCLRFECAAELSWKWNACVCVQASTRMPMRVRCEWQHGWRYTGGRREKEWKICRSIRLTSPPPPRFFLIEELINHYTVRGFRKAQWKGQGDGQNGDKKEKRQQDKLLASQTGIIKWRKEETSSRKDGITSGRRWCKKQRVFKDLRKKTERHESERKEMFTSSPGQMDVVFLSLSSLADCCSVPQRLV